jgi:hypothetical protein
MYNTPTLEAFTPAQSDDAWSRLDETVAAAIRVLAPWPEIRLASLEFQNKLETFELFEHVDATVQIPASGGSSPSQSN